MVMSGMVCGGVRWYNVVRGRVGWCDSEWCGVWWGGVVLSGVICGGVGW